MKATLLSIEWVMFHVDSGLVVPLNPALVESQVAKKVPEGKEITRRARVRIERRRRPPSVLELVWHKGVSTTGWMATASGRWLSELPDAKVIVHALDFVEVELPRARTVP